MPFPVFPRLPDKITQLLEHNDGGKLTTETPAVNNQIDKQQKRNDGGGGGGGGGDDASAARGGDAARGDARVVFVLGGVGVAIATPGRQQQHQRRLINIIIIIIFDNHHTHLSHVALGV